MHKTLKILATLLWGVFFIFLVTSANAETSNKVGESSSFVKLVIADPCVSPRVRAMLVPTETSNKLKSEHLVLIQDGDEIIPIKDVELSTVFSIFRICPR